MVNEQAGPSKGRLGLAALMLAALAGGSVACADVPLARWIAGLPEGVHAFFRAATAGFDRVSLKEFSDAGLGLGLLAAAGLAVWHPKGRRLAGLLALVALTQLIAHFAVGLLKPAFGRLRPYVIADSGWVDQSAWRSPF